MRRAIQSVLPAGETHVEYTFFSCRLFQAIVCKHDVVHKTGSTQRIAMPPEEDRALDKGDMQKFWESLSIWFLR